ncbi:hypothetical protein RhiirA1_482991, partial [Rhizophagus irregularis]
MVAIFLNLYRVIVGPSMPDRAIALDTIGRLLGRSPFRNILRGGLLLSGTEIIEWTAVLLILIGAIVSVISALGLIRLPDVYTRSHAASKSATLAVM